MTTTLNGLDIRRRLDRKVWGVPKPFGPDGWLFDTLTGDRRAIVSVSEIDDDRVVWVHASVSRRDRIPDYDDLKALHQAVWPDGYAYQCFVPPANHINIHAHALHLWGRLDGARVLPDFGFMGTI